MTRHYPDLGRQNLLQPFRRTTHIQLVTHHHYEISALGSGIQFFGETNVAKCRLFSQAGVRVTLSSEIAQKRGLLRHVMKKWNLPSTNMCSLVLTPLYNGPTTLQQSRSSLSKAAILDQEVQLSVHTFSTSEFW